MDNNECPRCSDYKAELAELRMTTKAVAAALVGAAEGATVSGAQIAEAERRVAAWLGTRD